MLHGSINNEIKSISTRQNRSVGVIRHLCMSIRKKQMLCGQMVTKFPQKLAYFMAPSSGLVHGKKLPNTQRLVC